MKRAPRGFEAVFEPDIAAALRKRSLIVRRPIAPEALGSTELTAEIAAFTKAAAPLLRFGWSAIDG